jgi:hypothetical protein
MPDGGEYYEDSEIAKVIIQVFDSTEGSENWSDLELSLGQLDYSQFLDGYDDGYYDENGEIDEKLYKYSYYNNEDRSSDLCGALYKLEDFFHDWIKSRRIKHNKISAFSNLINKNEDLFLTFNYTYTLEKIYNIKSSNICHIHGTQKDKIYFGHCNYEDKTDYYQAHWFGAESNLSQLERAFIKDVNSAFHFNKYFFDRIKDLGENIDIYSFGFSFASVDNLYIKSICDNINISKSSIKLIYSGNYVDTKESEIKDKFIALGFNKNNIKTIRI